MNWGAMGPLRHIANHEWGIARKAIEQGLVKGAAKPGICSPDSEENREESGLGQHSQFREASVFPSAMSRLNSGAGSQQGSPVFLCSTRNFSNTFSSPIVSA